MIDKQDGAGTSAGTFRRLRGAGIAVLLMAGAVHAGRGDATPEDIAMLNLAPRQPAPTVDCGAAGAITLRVADAATPINSQALAGPGPAPAPAAPPAAAPSRWPA